MMSAAKSISAKSAQPSSGCPVILYHAIGSGALVGESLAAQTAARAAEVPASAPERGAGKVADPAPTRLEISQEDDAASEQTLRRAARAIPDGIERFQDEIGDGTLTLTGCALFDPEGRPTQSFVAGESIRAGVTFVARQDFEADRLVAGYQIRDRFNNVVAADTSVNSGVKLPALRAGGRYALLIAFRGRLGQGKYLLDFGLGSDRDHADSARHYHHRIGGIAAFQVDWFGRQVTFQGICDLGARFSPVQPVGSL